MKDNTKNLIIVSLSFISGFTYGSPKGYFVRYPEPPEKPIIQDFF